MGAAARQTVRAIVDAALAAVEPEAAVRGPAKYLRAHSVASVAPNRWTPPVAVRVAGVHRCVCTVRPVAQSEHQLHDLGGSSRRGAGGGQSLPAFFEREVGGRAG